MRNLEFEFSPKLIRRSLIVAVGLILQSCSNASSADIRETLAPVERIDFEYGGDRVTFSGDLYLSGDTCLQGTVFDPVGSGKDGPAYPNSFEDENGKLIVELMPRGEFIGESQTVPLRLTGFDVLSQPLQPADEASRTIMTNLGCDFSSLK